MKLDHNYPDHKYPDKTELRITLPAQAVSRPQAVPCYLHKETYFSSPKQICAKHMIDSSVAHPCDLAQIIGR